MNSWQANDLEPGVSVKSTYILLLQLQYISYKLSYQQHIIFINNIIYSFILVIIIAMRKI